MVTDVNEKKQYNTFNKRSEGRQTGDYKIAWRSGEHDVALQLIYVTTAEAINFQSVAWTVHPITH